MIRTELLDMLHDDSLRIDKMIWLGANTCDTCRDLTEFLEDDPELAKKLLGTHPPSEPGEFDEYMSRLTRTGINGYLVLAATPLRDARKLYSWSAVRCKWFYFELWDEEVVARTLHDWVEQCLAVDVEKAKETNA